MDVMGIESDLKNIEILTEIGNKAELRIFEGKEVFMDENDRVWLREKSEQSGVSFEPLEVGHCEFGVTGRSVNTEQCDRGHTKIGGAEVKCQTIFAQTALLEAMMGREKLKDLVAGVVTELAGENGEGIFKGKYLINHPEIKETLELSDIDNFVRSFLDNGLNNKVNGVIFSADRARTDGKYTKEVDDSEKSLEQKEIEASEELEGRPDDWKKVAMYRMEAVISSTYRLLTILNSEVESIQSSENKYILWQLRERVIRGIEQASKVKVETPDGKVEYVVEVKTGESVKRYDKDDNLRELTVGGVAAILRRMCHN